MFKKYKKIILLVLIGVLMSSGVLLQVKLAQADLYSDTIDPQLQKIKEIGLPGYDKDEDRITDVIFDVIQMVLGTLALIFLILILIAGFRWMTSGGNEETITKAKKMISSALIGIVIIFLAYAITAFVFMVLLTDRVS